MGHVVSKFFNAVISFVESAIVALLETIQIIISDIRQFLSTLNVLVMSVQHYEDTGYKFEILGTFRDPRDNGITYFVVPFCVNSSADDIASGTIDISPCQDKRGNNVPPTIFERGSLAEAMAASHHYQPLTLAALSTIQDWPLPSWNDALQLKPDDWETWRLFQTKANGLQFSATLRHELPAMIKIDPTLNSNDVTVSLREAQAQARPRLVILRREDRGKHHPIMYEFQQQAVEVSASTQIKPWHRTDAPHPHPDPNPDAPTPCPCACPEPCPSPGSEIEDKHGQ